MQSIFLKFHPSPHLSVLYSLLYSFIFFTSVLGSFLLSLSLSSHFFFFKLLLRRDREKEREISSSFLFSVYTKSECLPTKRNERKRAEDEPARQQQTYTGNQPQTKRSLQARDSHLISPHVRLEGKGGSAREKRSLSLLRGRSSTREAWQPGSH